MKYLFQIHTKCIQNESKILSTFNQNPLKNEPLHVARGGVFNATDDIFSALGDVFEAFGRGAALTGWGRAGQQACPPGQQANRPQA